MLVATALFAIAVWLLPESPRLQRQRLHERVETELSLTHGRPPTSGVRALFRRGPGRMPMRTLFGAGAAVALTQLVGVTSSLFYAERLLALSCKTTPHATGSGNIINRILRFVCVYRRFLLLAGHHCNAVRHRLGSGRRSATVRPPAGCALPAGAVRCSLCGDARPARPALPLSRHIRTV